MKCITTQTLVLLPERFLNTQVLFFFKDFGFIVALKINFLVVILDNKCYSFVVVGLIGQK